MNASGQDFTPWVGKRQTVKDIISPVQVRQMAATLNDAARMQQPDCAPLPAGWHWLYFNPLEIQSRLGPDGHPARGDFLPPVSLERRMWAGSRLTWQRQFEVGMSIQKDSEILKISHKTGRSGDMVFVTVAHRYSDARGIILEEEHDIVYRPAAQATDPVPAPIAASSLGQPGEMWTRDVVPDDVLLFRYSALTFNGHRIHYDRQYVTTVEGYPGLIVHGPLIATLLMDLLRRQMPDADVASFRFKAVRPTFDLNAFHVHGQPQADGKTIRLWATDHEGWLTMDATATLR